MRGKPRPVVRIKDGKWYPTITSAAVDNEMDAMTMIARLKDGFQFKRVELSQEAVERHNRIQLERKRECTRQWARKKRAERRAVCD
jgi:hypothetical protein